MTLWDTFSFVKQAYDLCTGFLTMLYFLSKYLSPSFPLPQFASYLFFSTASFIIHERELLQKKQELNCLMSYGAGGAMERLNKDPQSRNKDQVMPCMPRASLDSLQVLRAEKTTVYPSAHVPFTMSEDNNGKSNTQIFPEKSLVLEMVSCLVQTIKKQPNYLGWREQTSATLSLQASTNRSEVLPQNEFTYAHLGPITDYIVLTVQEKQIKKC